jgi:hypothetical protein
VWRGCFLQGSVPRLFADAEAKCERLADGLTMLNHATHESPCCGGMQHVRAIIFHDAVSWLAAFKFA